VLILNTHDSTSPVFQEFVILIELLFEVFSEDIQILIIFLLDFGQSNAGGGLLVNKLSESCLSLNEAIGDSLLFAESGQEYQQLNWINIMSHNNELSFA